MTFGLGEYVLGENNLYSCEGKIIDMHESTGTKKGMLYNVEDSENGFSSYFFEDEITRVPMPTRYNYILGEMAKEWFYLNGDKRLARVDIFARKFIIQRKEDKVMLWTQAYNREYVYNTTMDEILTAFNTRPPKDFAHFKC